MTEKTLQELKDIFGDFTRNGGDYIPDYKYLDLYNWVQQTIKTERESIIKMIDDEIEKHGLVGDLYWQALTEIKNKLMEVK